MKLILPVSVRVLLLALLLASVAGADQVEYAFYIQNAPTGGDLSFVAITDGFISQPTDLTSFAYTLGQVESVLATPGEAFNIALGGSGSLLAGLLPAPGLQGLWSWLDGSEFIGLEIFDSDVPANPFPVYPTVVVTDPPPDPVATPEPSALYLLLAGLISLCCIKVFRATGAS